MISSLKTLDNLKELPHLHSLCLQGNPITKNPIHYRMAIIKLLPKLISLDNKTITEDERRISREQYSEDTIELDRIIQTSRDSSRGRHKQSGTTNQRSSRRYPEESASVAAFKHDRVSNASISLHSMPIKIAPPTLSRPPEPIPPFQFKPPKYQSLEPSLPQDLPPSSPPLTITSPLKSEKSPEPTQASTHSSHNHTPPRSTHRSHYSRSTSSHRSQSHSHRSRSNTHRSKSRSHSRSQSSPRRAATSPRHSTSSIPPYPHSSSHQDIVSPASLPVDIVALREVIELQEKQLLKMGDALFELEMVVNGHSPDEDENGRTNFLGETSYPAPSNFSQTVSLKRPSDVLPMWREKVISLLKSKHLVERTFTEQLRSVQDELDAATTKLREAELVRDVNAKRVSSLEASLSMEKTKNKLLKTELQQTHFVHKTSQQRINSQSGSIDSLVSMVHSTHSNLLNEMSAFHSEVENITHHLHRQMDRIDNKLQYCSDIVSSAQTKPTPSKRHRRQESQSPERSMSPSDTDNPHTSPTKIFKHIHSFAREPQSESESSPTRHRSRSAHHRRKSLSRRIAYLERELQKERFHRQRIEGDVTRLRDERNEAIKLLQEEQMMAEKTKMNLTSALSEVQRANDSNLHNDETRLLEKEIGLLKTELERAKQLQETTIKQLEREKRKREEADREWRQKRNEWKDREEEFTRQLRTQRGRSLSKEKDHESRIRFEYEQQHRADERKFRDVIAGYQEKFESLSALLQKTEKEKQTLLTILKKKEPPSSPPSHLKHPGILQVLDTYEDPNIFCFVTKHVIPLALATHAISSEFLFKTLPNILKTLQFLHKEQNVLHNNVSIDSIYVLIDGSQLLLSDFWSCHSTRHSPPYLSRESQTYCSCVPFQPSPDTSSALNSDLLDFLVLCLSLKLHADQASQDTFQKAISEIKTEEESTLENHSFIQSNFEIRSNQKDLTRHERDADSNVEVNALENFKMWDENSKDLDKMDERYKNLREALLLKEREKNQFQSTRKQFFSPDLDPLSPSTLPVSIDTTPQSDEASHKLLFDAFSLTPVTSTLNRKHSHFKFDMPKFGSRIDLRHEGSTFHHSFHTSVHSITPSDISEVISLSSMPEVIFDDPSFAVPLAKRIRSHSFDSAFLFGDRLIPGHVSLHPFHLSRIGRSRLLQKQKAEPDTRERNTSFSTQRDSFLRSFVPRIASGPLHPSTLKFTNIGDNETSVSSSDEIVRDEFEIFVQDRLIPLFVSCGLPQHFLDNLGPRVREIDTLKKRTLAEHKQNEEDIALKHNLESPALIPSLPIVSFSSDSSLDNLNSVLNQFHFASPAHTEAFAFEQTASAVNFERHFSFCSEHSPDIPETSITVDTILSLFQE
ncbi:hypothetical protein BLNAU_6416 [Blattamonas nauphoetae]|uniref:Protein kinase domain-containing protein n=1 Tax=Blattamonas nauphoetae TaxID=2049346 RepID=A0ABQ9Y4H1_9EUKA|nr:hypothetical protein BLNAU_6416 [Blattamonas nauphoetae]